MKKKLRILALAMAALFVLSCLSVAGAVVSPGGTVTLIATTNIYLPTSSSTAGTLTLTKSTKQLPAGTQVNVMSTSGGYAKIMVRDSSTSTPYAAYIPITSFTTSSSGSSSSIVGVGSVTGPSGTTGTTTATGTAGVITNCVSGVNFRTGAGTSNTLLGTLPKGAPVMVLSSTTGSDGKTWYKVTYNGTTGYVSGQYVSVTGTVTSGSGTTGTTGTTGTVSGTTSTTGTPGVITNCTSGVNFRSSASSSSSKLGTLPKGATISILSSTTGSDGDTWYKVTYGATTGYVHGDYVSTSGSVSSDSTGASGSYNKYDTAQTMVSLDSTIYMRKTPSSSTSSSNVVKKLTGVKGKAFSILGESGSWYYAQYSSYQGYVRKQDFSAASTSTSGFSYATVTGTSADRWGTIVQIPGTKIGSAYGKLYDNSIYCNGLNSKQTDYYYNTYSGSKNYFFSLVPQNAETAVISGHNMQSSQTGLHDLHHVQNYFLGVSTCEESNCRASCSNIGASSTFKITYGGKSTWQVVGFFELNQDTMKSESSRKSAQSYILLGGWNLTGAAKQSWLTQVLSYANSSYKGKTLSSASSSDKIMILYTCGDHGNSGARASANGAGSSGGGYQNLYFILKAVG